MVVQQKNANLEIQEAGNHILLHNYFNSCVSPMKQDFN